MDLIITISLLVIALSIIIKGKLTIEIVHTNNSQSLEPSKDLEESEENSIPTVDDFVNSINDLMGVNNQDNAE